MQSIHYILIILFSCLTGWLVIRLILKILFWPEKPLPALGFKFQGLLPKHQPLIAEQLAEMAGREFFSISSLKEKAANPASFDKLKPEIEYHIDHFLREKLKESFPMLSMFIGDKTINQLKGAFLLELESLFPVIMNSYLSNLENDLNPKQLIAEKIAGLSLKRSGILANKSAKKLFIRLQLAGALTGLLMGLLQVLLFRLLA
mgnify:CR=1 FL=1